MAPPKIIPALADLTQDMAGPVPVSLLYDWAAGDQDDQRATALLDPFRIAGTVVSSDTSGLSRLTKERDLLDVLSLISEPKQILHAIGVEIGGRPIGTWVADNTQTYYPPAIAAEDIIVGMTEAEHRITCELPVGVGMCVHNGAFYELGGGLYGPDAHVVEFIAEHHAGPGEILVTAAVRNDCPDSFGFRARADLDSHGAGGIFSLSNAPGMRHLEATNRRYPHPWPPEFFDRLMALKTSAEKDDLRQQIYDTYLKRLVVVFVARDRVRGPAPTTTGLLDDLIANVLFDALVSGLDAARGHVAGLGGGLGILTYDGAPAALEAADALRRRFAANSLPIKIGMASGPVLYFPNPRGPSGIAGSPVNIASKISEDAGLPGKINIASDVAAQLAPQAGAAPFEITIGGVVLHGVTV
jgi:class 3 adenylate cyclase